MFKKLAIITTTALISLTSSQVFAAGIAVNADATLIDNLPKSGKVTIAGVVDKVNSNHKFMLKDSNGKTIDVNTNNEISVNEGDKVTVTGDLSSEMLGMGKQIENAGVSTAGLDVDTSAGHDISITKDGEKASDNDEDYDNDNDE